MTESAMLMEEPSFQQAGRPVQLGTSADHARAYLARAWNGEAFPCLTGETRHIEGNRAIQAESFTAMIIADLLYDVPKLRPMVGDIVESLVEELGDEDVYYFFKDHARLPADADCTALGLSVLLRVGTPVHEVAHRALDRIAQNRNEAGVVETYFDPTGERDGIVDPVVCCNVLYLAHQLGREHEFVETVEYVAAVLEDGRYLEGTRYYPSPETFLYFLGRIVTDFPYSALTELVGARLRRVVAERIATSDSVLDLAQRSLLCRWLGIPSDHERVRLEGLQESPGSWPADALFQYGRTERYFGSGSLSTAFAVAAIHGQRRLARIAASSFDRVG